MTYQAKDIQSVHAGPPLARLCRHAQLEEPLQRLWEQTSWHIPWFRTKQRNERLMLREAGQRNDVSPSAIARQHRIFALGGSVHVEHLSSYR